MTESMIGRGVCVLVVAAVAFAATSTSLDFGAATKWSVPDLGEWSLQMPPLFVILAALLIGYLLQFLYEMLFVPFHKKMTLEEIEHDNELSGFGSAIGSRSRRAGNTPPPYPNGWYKVMDSRALARKQVVNMQYLGQHLVAFRGESGHAHVMDAYCPHLGANLGSGGKVEGDEIVCPFHGWKFDGKSGKCSDIPYSTADVPEQAHSRAWHTCETNGHIYLWFDAEGRAPLWEVIHTPEIDSGQWYFHGSSEHEVKAHIQEMPENGADAAHLDFLHVPMAVKLNWLQKIFQHDWEISWEKGKGDDEHKAFIVLHQRLTIMGWRLPGGHIRVDGIQQGPGLVFLRFTTPFGKAIVMETVTPMKPLLQKAAHMIYSEWRMPRWFAKLVIAGFVVQFERDVPIWNNKMFLKKPVVVKGDGPIPQFRRWYSQFYSESSEKYRGNVTLDW